jgi:hypothetical protein
MSDNIIHSDEVNELITQNPGRLVQYGAYIFLSLIMILLVLCWTIEYSDTEQGECIIYSNNPPRPVAGGTAGQLGSLFVADGMHVTRNQSLGVIKTSIGLNDVLKLEALAKSCLENVKQNTLEKITISPASFNKIGEFQGVFQQLYWTHRQIASVVQSPLYKRINSTGTSTNPPSDLLEYQKQFFELLSEFVHSINEVDENVTAWKQKYLLTAPIDGTVIFSDVVFNNKEIEQGEQVFYISPQSEDYYAQMTLSQAGYSKVKPGQHVSIKLEGRSNRQPPLYGRVSYISPIINNEGKVTVKMLFDKQQITKSGQPLNLAHELKGTGTIITERNNLLTKILRSMKI